MASLLLLLGFGVDTDAAGTSISASRAFNYLHYVSERMAAGVHLIVTVKNIVLITDVLLDNERNGGSLLTRDSVYQRYVDSPIAIPPKKSQMYRNRFKYG